MKTGVAALGLGCLLFLLLFGVGVGVATGVYFLVAYFGAPQWVAVLAAVAVFFFAGGGARVNRG